MCDTATVKDSGPHRISYGPKELGLHPNPATLTANRWADPLPLTQSRHRGIVPSWRSGPGAVMHGSHAYRA